MRKTLLPAVLLSVFALAGCGSGAADTAKDAKASVSDQTVAAYTVLAKDFNGFLAALDQIEDDPEADEPTTPEEVTEASGYEFAEGVTLSEYGFGEAIQVCLTGPDSTYLALQVEDQITRTFGTGECDYTDGDLVLELAEDDSASGIEITEKALKGAALAKQMSKVLDANPMVVRENHAAAVDNTAACIEDPENC